MVSKKKGITKNRHCENGYFFVVLEKVGYEIPYEIVYSENCVLTKIPPGGILRSVKDTPRWYFSYLRQSEGKLFLQFAAGEESCRAEISCFRSLPQARILQSGTFYGFYNVGEKEMTECENRSLLH